MAETELSTPEFEYDIESAIVTGATGDVGSWVVDQLADRGVDVVGVDFDRPDGVRANVDFRAVDLTEGVDTWETIAEVDPDAVVHLAALSDPLENPSTRLFENNVTSAYNVLQAAGREGIDVVWSSSQATYGALFAASTWTPDYLPIDEAHDRRPEDAYGLSKVCGEEIAKSMARRYGISVATIRPATIFSPTKERARPTEDGSDLSSEEPTGNFASYVDVRDVARMIEAALAADLEGHEEFLCVADENYLGRPTAELVETVCGSIPRGVDLEGKESALSNAKAADVLGWTPAHTWHEGADEDVSGPTWL
ncbi:NAD-dependent epimerase/dehydratase [Haloterrigena salina JCM 13891]|uniref:NAD-dependent epimerase/dehydratase n=1 Tax=Haloterrigena salina JCM 13891 TaxID=1227488 RepID=M0CJ20_9EURY|nr:NAD(P)-dependent oxidoreductase [Haloterrigena salina]ELZ23285.1 NAD-dependent epimerase/dehydratase [Haloterrigena salina JCM 13891]